jgi:4-diphosphocytidyl-2-C-methyl-D-erythritol kinase
VSPPEARAGARVEAQAKVNLFLRVQAREPNGYHQIETLFQRIALADAVTLRVDVPGRSLQCRGADVGPVEQNLAWRAAVAFAHATGWPRGFAIEIDKRIPVGGGLGGGSSDAAAVLRALNALCPRTCPVDSLAAIAFELGADVPYLVSDFPLALGTGRGERLRQMTPLPSRDVLLLAPAFRVSSGDAFAWYDAMHGAQGPDQPHVVWPTSPSWEEVSARAMNDLEPAVFARHAGLAALRESLESRGASIARMTGSGSTVFGVYDPQRTRRDITPEFVAPGLDARLIETATVSRVASVELF